MSEFDPTVAHTPSWYSRLLVGMQILSAAALVLSVRSLAPFPMLAMAFGASLGMWAVLTIGLTRVSLHPEVRARAVLITVGPYRLIRHPMYTALLLFCAGFVFSPYRLWKLGAWLLLLLILYAKTRIEERQLLARFPDYAHYAQRSWRFLPWI